MKSKYLPIRCARFPAALNWPQPWRCRDTELLDGIQRHVGHQGNKYQADAEHDDERPQIVWRPEALPEVEDMNLYYIANSGLLIFVKVWIGAAILARP